MPENAYRILVVDDLPDWRKTIKGLLTDAGYHQVDVAESKQAALELLEAKSFDLAILDMRLDETNEDNIEGLDLAAEIRRGWPQVKIIMLTGYGNKQTQERALRPDRSGQSLAADFINKTETNHIIATVQRVLSQPLLNKP